MKYFFIPGNNLALSVAEINAFFSKNSGFFVKKEAIILDLNEELPFNTLKNLGGAIKFGVVIKEMDGGGNILEREILSDIKENWPEIDKKVSFGISFYGEGGLNTRRLGLNIKSELRKDQYKVRLVESREKQLSSVVVSENIIRKKGREYVIFKNGNKFVLGYTVNVQPFKDLSFRDYGRPGRDDHSGMIPPKLAQIMINIATRGDKSLKLLDPFCGSGTILTEALLMSFTKVIGSDVSIKAVQDTEKNINWIKEKYCLDNFKAELVNLKAEDVDREIDHGSIDVIVTEPYLGPQRGKVDVATVKKELEVMYGGSLKAFEKVLRSSGTIVMIWPIFVRRDGWTFLSPDIAGFEMVSLLSDSIIRSNDLKLSKRNTLVYMRSGQKVAREIIVLKHKKRAR